MARDGNGNYTKAEADFVGGSVINATAMNSNFDDIAVALTNSIAKNGETKVTGDIDFNSNKAVNVKDATASADATNLKVIQNRVGVHGTSSGTDTITLTLSPAISDYIAGQEFTFKAGGTNTDATTLNINTKGAKDVLTQQGLALTANSIVADKFYKVRYDGTSFILLDDIPINVLTPKTTLTDNDKGVIEDSEALNVKKSFDLSSVWNYIKGKFISDPISGTVIGYAISSALASEVSTTSTSYQDVLTATYTPKKASSVLEISATGSTLKNTYTGGGGAEANGTCDAQAQILDNNNSVRITGGVQRILLEARTNSTGVLNLHNTLKIIGYVNANNTSERTFKLQLRVPSSNGGTATIEAGAFLIIREIAQ